MSKPIPVKIDDLSVLLTFPESAKGEAVVELLQQQLRNNERALVAHKERQDAAALKSDAALAKHHEETQVFERVSARLTAAINHARQRVDELRQSELRQAGEEARAQALKCVEESGALLRDILDQAMVISAALEKWGFVSAEVARLNGIAVAGGSESAAMAELPDEAEALAEARAEVGPALEKFLKDRAYEVYVRARNAQRKAEAEKARQAEMANTDEAVKLSALGFDAELLTREPLNADESYKRTLVYQALCGIRRKASDDDRLMRIAADEGLQRKNAPPRVGSYDLTPTGRI